jgi:toxin secretion/phage lysis holin
MGLDYKIILTAFLSYAAYLLGGFDKGLEVLIIMTIIDYLTGLMKAVCNKCLSSYIGWRGLVKKTSVFICIMVAVQIEKLIDKPNSLHDLVAFAFVVNEGISITENLVAIGVPVPKVLVKFLNKMKDKGDCR